MPIITRITPTKRDSSRFSVYLDGNFAFALDEYIVKKHNLSKTTELTHELIQELVFEENLEYLKQRALDLVSRRPRSEKEIKDKLKEKLFKRISSSSHSGRNGVKIRNLESQLIKKVLKFLRKYDYLDDKKFAEWLVEQRLNQNKGPKYIRQDLYKKGIDKDMISQVLEDLDTSEALKKALKKAQKKYSKEKDKYKQRNKIYSYLARRGFNYENIKQILK